MNIIKRDSYSVRAGIEIRIPFDIADILREFEILNNPPKNE